MKHAYKTFATEVKLKFNFYNYLFEISNPFKGPLDEIVSFFKTNGKPGESCYIDNEHESLAYYTGMKLIHRDHIKALDTPDWIVLRGDYRHAIDKNLPSEVAQNLREILGRHPYSKMELDAPAMRVNNSYDMQIRLFRSPYSADKVVVYKRINH